MTNLIIGYAKHRANEYGDEYNGGAISGTAILFVCALLAVLLTADGAAASGRDDGYGRPGVYVSIGLGGATDSFDRNVFELEQGTAVTIGSRVGYRVSKFVGLEAALDYTVSGFHQPVLTPSGSGELDTRTLVGSGNLKLYLSDWRVQPFALGGFGGLYSDLDCRRNAVSVPCATAGLSSNDWVFAGRVGGGLDFYLTKNLALSTEIAYVMPTGELADLRYVSFGGQVVVRF